MAPMGNASNRWAVVLWLAAGLGTVAHGEAPASPGTGSADTPGGAATQPSIPTTAPTTRPARARPRLVVPPGFTKHDIGGRFVLIQESDKDWVTTAIQQVASGPPVTRPSTMPADLVTNIDTFGDALVHRLATDLAVADQEVLAWRDTELLPTLRRFVAEQPRPVALVLTKQRLRDLMRAGWESPVVRYNRVADEIFFSDAIVLTPDGDSADAVVPIIMEPDATAEANVARLAESFRRLDEFAFRARGERAEYLLQALLLKYFAAKCLEGQDLKLDEEWLRVGVAGVLTAKYTSLISGVSRRAVIVAMTADVRGQLRARSIDLLHPVSPSDMKPEAMLPYVDAIRRKSILVIDDLLFRHGDEVIPNILKAVREKKPDNGAALLEVIKQECGTDLTASLRPN